MKSLTNGCLTALCGALLLLAALPGQTNKAAASTNKVEASIFPDKNLEAAVRKFVFEKRDNDKPITEGDVANLSTIQGGAMDIADLSGLEKCLNLASLELPKNKIK